jgi:hypothetical protein
MGEERHQEEKHRVPNAYVNISLSFLKKLDAEMASCWKRKRCQLH